MYLRAFVEDYSDEEFVQDMLNQDEAAIEQDQEIVKLKALVSDLRQDRLEKVGELEQFRSGGNDQSRFNVLTMEEMKDDIEFLTGENKELWLKVKDVCLKNSQLKLKVADLMATQRIAQE